MGSPATAGVAAQAALLLTRWLWLMRAAVILSLISTFYTLFYTLARGEPVRDLFALSIAFSLPYLAVLALLRSRRHAPGALGFAAGWMSAFLAVFAWPIITRAPSAGLIVFCLIQLAGIGAWLKGLVLLWRGPLTLILFAGGAFCAVFIWPVYVMAVGEAFWSSP